MNVAPYPCRPAINNNIPHLQPPLHMIVSSCTQVGPLAARDFNPALPFLYPRITLMTRILFGWMNPRGPCNLRIVIIRVFPFRSVQPPEHYLSNQLQRCAPA
jgi:hypothetical protein